jgi:hypothetical protein
VIGAGRSVRCGGGDPKDGRAIRTRLAPAGDDEPTTAITLATYSHLWPDANDRTRRAAGELMDVALAAAADPLRTESEV